MFQRLEKIVFNFAEILTLEKTCEVLKCIMWGTKFGFSKHRTNIIFSTAVTQMQFVWNYLFCLNGKG